MNRLILGPVTSRRFGRSLGLNVVPKKVCNLDCIYCEVGPTTVPGLERDFYTSWKDIKKQFLDAFEEDNFDCITVTGMGEPTLNLHLKSIVQYLKKYTDVPIVLLTNSLLLTDSKTRNDVSDFSVIAPSLDCVTLNSFTKVDRPLIKITPDEIVQGLIKLRSEFKGEIWLEILFIKGLNDSLDEVQKLKKSIEKINPDKVHLSTLSRQPLTAIKYKCQSDIVGLEYSELRNIKTVLGDCPSYIILKEEENFKESLCEVNHFYWGEPK